MWTRFLSLMVLLAFGAGCGLHAQTYVMTKPRVGIEKGTGNAGYLTGTPVYVEPQEKTRKVYVLEITKAVPESEVKKVEQAIASVPKVNTAVDIPAAPQAAPVPVAETVHNRIVIPPIEETPTVPAPAKVTNQQVLPGPTKAITYTVRKDDTLQKIAKKYYGTYSAWLKIYNANKEKIKNPNFLRPGTEITIPVAK